MNQKEIKIILIFLFLNWGMNLYSQPRFDRINIYTQHSFIAPALPTYDKDDQLLRENSFIFLSSKEQNFIKDYSRFISSLSEGEKIKDDFIFMSYTIIDFLIQDSIIYTISLNERHDYRISGDNNTYKKNEELWNFLGKRPKTSQSV